MPLYYNVPIEIVCRTDEDYDNPENPNLQMTSKIKIIDYKQNSLDGDLINKSKQRVATVHIGFKILN